MKDTEFSHKNGNICASEIRQMRKIKHESQTEFWRRFRVTQSRGSRFEMGLAIPKATATLVSLYLRGIISDSDLGEPEPYQTQVKIKHNSLRA